MPIETDLLASIALHYTEPMTSIRGRRVQRLVQRELAGAEHVLSARLGASPALVGLSPSGAALIATNGRGSQVSVVRWLHHSTEALASHYDLLKDSLPLLRTTSGTLDGPPREVLLSVSQESAPPPARELVVTAIQALLHRAA